MEAIEAVMLHQAILKCRSELDQFISGLETPLGVHTQKPIKPGNAKPGRGKTFSNGENADTEIRTRPGS